VVADAQVKYLVPAKLADMLVVTVKVVEIGRASMLLEQQALRGDTLLVDGRFRIGCVDALSLRPRRIPDSASKHLFAPV
jgi:acyl-CoA thioester hydrolase